MMPDDTTYVKQCPKCNKPVQEMCVKGVECKNCYRRRRRKEDGRYNYEHRIGKRAEQKRAWDRENRQKKAGSAT